MCDPIEAELFLARLKPIIEAGLLQFDPRNRRKTWEFMLNEGLGEEDAIDILSRLLPGHCRKGPMSDLDGSPGDVMTFGYPYTSLLPPCERVMLYIKLKIWTDSRGEAGIIMSFHPEGIV